MGETSIKEHYKRKYRTRIRVEKRVHPLSFCVLVLGARKSYTLLSIYNDKSYFSETIFEKYFRTIIRTKTKLKHYLSKAQ